MKCLLPLLIPLTLFSATGEDIMVFQNKLSFWDLFGGEERIEKIKKKEDIYFGVLEVSEFPNHRRHSKHNYKKTKEVLIKDNEKLQFLVSALFERRNYTLPQLTSLHPTSVITVKG